MRQILDMLSSRASFDDSPPWTTSRIHEMVRRVSGNADPYKEEKVLHNSIALDLLPRLELAVADSADPFTAAARIAIAGNIIDPSIVIGFDEATMRSTLNNALNVPLAINHIDALRARAASAQRILYLGDNAGEIVFDQLLLKQLPLDRTLFAVRGRPIINDATREDAVAVGLTRIVQVIDNGSDVPGTVLRHCSLEFRAAFTSADLIISKGQGNYETLNDAPDPRVFFLLKVKCAVVAADLGVEHGAVVVKQSIT